MVQGLGPEVLTNKSKPFLCSHPLCIWQSVYSSWSSWKGFSLLSLVYAYQWFHFKQEPSNFNIIFWYSKWVCNTSTSNILPIFHIIKKLPKLPKLNKIFRDIPITKPILPLISTLIHLGNLHDSLTAVTQEQVTVAALESWLCSLPKGWRGRSSAQRLTWRGRPWYQQGDRWQTRGNNCKKSSPSNKPYGSTDTA